MTVPEGIMLVVLTSMVGGVLWTNRKNRPPPGQTPIALATNIGCTAMSLVPFAVIVSLALWAAYLIADALWVG